MAEELKDISLSSKKSFRIDGDNNRIIYLDTSDMNILVRLEETYPEIQRLAVEAADKIVKSKISEDEEGDEETKSSLNDITEILKEIDSKMRAKLNYIFASDVADICEPTGNMYADAPKCAQILEELYVFRFDQNEKTLRSSFFTRI